MHRLLHVLPHLYSVTPYLAKHTADIDATFSNVQHFKVCSEQINTYSMLAYI